MSPEEFRQLMVDAKIIDANGKLLPPYSIPNKRKTPITVGD